MARPERIFARTEEHTLLSPVSAASEFSELAPSPPLRRHVERIRLGHERIPPGQTVVERVIPDGAVHVLFHLATPTAAHAAEVAGPSSRAELITMSGTVEAVGVQLRPGGVLALLGVPAGELAGRSVDLASLWGRDATTIVERLAATPRHLRAPLLEQILVERLARASTAADPHRGAALAMRRIADTGGRLPVAELAAGLGVGERRLEQVFHAHVGLSPKAASRLMRFRAAVDLLQRTPRPSWTDIACDAGYYDQAHLVRDWKAVSGLAPTAFAASAGFGSVQDEPRRRR
jgi:AraC-like DNA-binding protein